MRKQRHRLVGHAEEEVADEIEGRPVGPVDVVDEHRGRSRPGGLDHEPGQGQHLPGVLAVPRLAFGEVVEVQVAERTHAPEELHVALAAGTSPRAPGRAGANSASRSGQVREVEVLVAAAPNDGDAGRARADEELLHQAGLADAGVALDEDEMAVAAGREVEAGPQPAELPPPADQVRGRVARLTGVAGGTPGQ